MNDHGSPSSVSAIYRAYDPGLARWLGEDPL
jgi:hypothetical protein